MDYSPRSSSVHGISQARILEWVAIYSSRGSCQPRDQTQVSHIASRLYHLSHQGSVKTSLSSVQLLSRVWLFATPQIAARQASLSNTNSRSSLRLTSIESVMPSSHLILCRPLLLLPQSLPASESVSMSQLFAWGGQSTGVSALASFLPKWLIIFNTLQPLCK